MSLSKFFDTWKNISQIIILTNTENALILETSRLIEQKDSDKTTTRQLEASDPT